MTRRNPTRQRRRRRQALPLVLAVLFGVVYRCQSLVLVHQQPPLVPPQETTITKSFSGRLSSTQQVPYPGSFLHEHTTLLLASSSLAAMEPQTQSQQMNDAMVLSTMRGTEWRVQEERYLTKSAASFGVDAPKTCKSIATFSGFASDANKGTVSVDYRCGGDFVTTARGRWVSKPSRIAKGSIQLTARWKVKPPGANAAPVIYKGYIDASPMRGRMGKPVEAEMAGLLITGETVGTEKVIGKFTADFVRQLGEEEVDAIKISGGEIYTAPLVENEPTTITLAPKQ